MTALDLDAAAARGGEISCVCGPIPDSDVALGREVWRLAAAFALAILAQALMLTALPVAGAYSAPSGALANLPYALMFFGAAIAGLPASLLLDQFGRQAAFALGASFGVAGGAVAAWAILYRHFPALCVGAAWLGIAQGFALFYRHAAAIAHLGGPRSALLVLLGGAGGGLLAPLAVGLCHQALGPLADAGLAALAGFASLAALPLLINLPHRFAEARHPQAADQPRPSFWLATLTAAAAWFAMTHVMTRAPSGLIACGLAPAAIGGVAAWHLVLMYAPMAITARWPRAIPTSLALTIGVAFALVSVALRRVAPVEIMTALVLAGFGWSLAQVGAGRLLYDGRTLSKIALGLHDSFVLAAALAGVLIA
ncbi:MAG TPA: MFS transporter [Roseiarcus sp.]|nr:MFS transporter [Roseiarcus sp.]